MNSPLRAAIVGATGYTGSELVRFLHAHPSVQLGSLVGHSRAGENVVDVLPNLHGIVKGEIEAFDAGRLASHHDMVFCALPHGASAPSVAALRAAGTVVFDLSADFRLRSLETYEQWYGKHTAPTLFGTAVYGLVELYGEALKSADLIAVPGCYPTSTVLGLAPLLRDNLISHEGIIVDAKSGISGAGRKPGLHAHFPEVGEGFRAYKSAGRHRHTSEIEQELTALAGEQVVVSFTPHLLPMTRGILATSYAVPLRGVTAEQATEAAKKMYQNSSAVVVLPVGSHPDTAWVRGANRAMISYALDPRANRLVVLCAIDNLVKGAAGQAIQAMNQRFGFDADAGLPQIGLWP